MDFVTLHDLSRELNIPARVVRYRFHQLRGAGKLIEDADFRREDFVDEQHFTWKINPLSYMRETATNVARPPLGYQAGNQSDNKTAPLVNDLDTKTPEPVTRPVANSSPGNQPTDNAAADSSLHREVIEILKEQMHTKDEQIKTKDAQLKDLSDQMRGINDLNIKLVGQNVHQAERIQELLQLTTETPARAEAVTRVDTNLDDLVNNAVNQPHDFVTSRDASESQSGHHINDSDAGQGSRKAA